MIKRYETENERRVKAQLAERIYTVRELIETLVDFDPEAEVHQVLSNDNDMVIGGLRYVYETEIGVPYTEGRAVIFLNSFDDSQDTEETKA